MLTHVRRGLCGLIASWAAAALATAQDAPPLETAPAPPPVISSPSNSTSDIEASVEIAMLCWTPASSFTSVIVDSRPAGREISAVSKAMPLAVTVRSEPPLPGGPVVPGSGAPSPPPLTGLRPWTG